MFGWLIHGNDRDEKKEDDSNLISKLGRGDASAIEELFHLYFDRIYSMVYNQTGRNQAIAEDIVQETWLAAIKSARKFKGKSKPYTWLCGIAWHKIKDFQRHHYRDMAKLRQPLDLPNVPELQVIDSEPLPGEVIEREETKEIVRRALASLPKHYQQVLTLKYVEDMPAKDISQVLAKSTKSIESLLDRAKAALRDEIIRLSK